MWSWTNSAAWALVVSVLMPPIVLATMAICAPSGLRIDATSLTVLSHTVRAGQWLRYEFQTCLNVKPPLFVASAREIELVPVDGADIVALPPPMYFLVMQPCESREFLVLLPPVLPGRYILRVTTSVTTNPLHTDHAVWESNEFNVLKDESDVVK